MVLNFMESSNSAFASALWIFKIANSLEFLCCRDMELCGTLPNHTKLPSYFKLNPITLSCMELCKKSTFACADLNLQKSATASVLKFKKMRNSAKSDMRILKLNPHVSTEN